VCPCVAIGVVGTTRASPLGSKRLVPAVPRNSLLPVHAPFTPVAVCPVIRHPTDLSQRDHAPLVLTILPYEASSVGSLSFVSRTHICSRSFIELWPQRSPPVFTAAAWSDLRPAPESQSRRAHPHLSRSLRQSLYAPFLASPQHTVIKTVAADRSNQPLRETGPRRRETSRRIVLAIKMQRAARKREKASAADSEPFPSILFYVHFPTRTTCNASWFPSASCRLASPSR
jgi:hypothetical protein